MSITDTPGPQQGPRAQSWLPPEQPIVTDFAMAEGEDAGSGGAAAGDEQLTDAAGPADAGEQALPVAVAPFRVDDGSAAANDPLRTLLMQLGYLSSEQAVRVEVHAGRRGLDFDQAALELGYITPDDLDRVREQLVSNLGQPVVRRSPLSDELIVIHDPTGVRSEAVRLLRTQIIAQHVKSGRRGLAMVSPTAGSGCSTLVANLAVSMAQVGIKVLLVDANLRQPQQHLLFGLEADVPGLSTYLSLQVNRPERVVQPNVVPNLALITAGPQVARPQELLSSRRFRDGVNMLLREYDIVLFDTPPANTSADALTVGAAAGYVLVVARRDHAFVKDIATMVEQLQAARCPVIGSVLNEF